MKRRYFSIMVIIFMLFSAGAQAASFTSSAVKISGTTFTTGKKANTLISRLGLNINNPFKKKPGCIKSGFDKTFKKTGIMVYTVCDSKKADLIEEIVITSSKYPTSKGLKVGDKVSRIKSLYGTARSVSKSGIHNYRSGKYEMNVVTSKAGKITKISLLYRF